MSSIAVSIAEIEKIIENASRKGDNVSIDNPSSGRSMLIIYKIPSDNIDMASDTCIYFGFMDIFVSSGLNV